MMKTMLAAALVASAMSAPALAQKGGNANPPPTERCVSVLTNDEAKRLGISTGKGSGESVEVIATGNKSGCD